MSCGSVDTASPLHLQLPWIQPTMDRKYSGGGGDTKAVADVYALCG